MYGKGSGSAAPSDVVEGRQQHARLGNQGQRGLLRSCRVGCHPELLLFIFPARFRLASDVLSSTLLSLLDRRPSKSAGCSDCLGTSATSTNFGNDFLSHISAEERGWTAGAMAEKFVKKSNNKQLSGCVSKQAESDKYLPTNRIH
ncbi:hypothetical protein EJB05_25718, partial [Eragrostis curvula]